MKPVNVMTLLIKDIINIKDFDSNLLKLDKELFKTLTFITLGISQ